MKPQEKCCQISLSKRSISWPRRPFIRVDFVVSELCPENSAFSSLQISTFSIIRFTLNSAKVPPKGKVNWYYDYRVNFFIGIFTNASAIPIKCFLSHRRTDPFFFFFEIVKKKFQIRSSKKRVLYFTSTRTCFINNWNDVMSLSLINVYTTSFI